MRLYQRITSAGGLRPKPRFSDITKAVATQEVMLSGTVNVKAAVVDSLEHKIHNVVICVYMYF